jgi:predicted butyrate kinase (DUF1464 family)
MLSLGIDHDTTAWRAATWDEDRAAELRTFARPSELWDFVQELVTLHPAIPIVLPSGFGIPVTRVAEIMDRDIGEMTLVLGRPIADELGTFLAEARRRSLRAFCIPAVKLLPSVPSHRKVNRLDLGTADALCAAAWALHCLQATGRPYEACNFLLLHTRIDARSLLVVLEGRIVDGIGATVGQGDSLPERLRAVLRSRPGGRSRPARVNDIQSRSAGCGDRGLWEATTKESLGLLDFHRLSEVIPTGVRRIECGQAVGARLPLVELPAQPDGYEAALGAAVVAAGLTGGPTASLVERLGLWEARERVGDWITG